MKCESRDGAKLFALLNLQRGIPMFKRSFRQVRAFTLIELLIVVAIIGILAAIAVPNFLNAQVRAKVARAEAEERTLHTAISSYQMDRNVYPTYAYLAPPYRWIEQLTTPIAYLTSRISDPFSAYNKENSNFMFVDAWQDAYCYHDYKEAKRNNWGDQYSERLGRTWAFWTVSLGPSLNYDESGAVPGSNYDRIARYDSSNGTMSIGLIYRVGP